MMRTTATLDDDMAARLEQKVRRSGKSFQRAVSDALWARLATGDPIAA